MNRSVARNESRNPKLTPSSGPSSRAVTLRLRRLKPRRAKEATVTALISIQPLCTLASDPTKGTNRPRPARAQLRLRSSPAQVNAPPSAACQGPDCSWPRTQFKGGCVNSRQTIKGCLGRIARSEQSPLSGLFGREVRGLGKQSRRPTGELRPGEWRGAQTKLIHRGNKNHGGQCRD
jgi:hypothetical protein